MKIIVMFVIIYLLFVVLELVPLLKSKKYKELSLYTLILVTAFSVEMGTIFDLNIPSINIGITNLVHHILG